jgi:hypothetical protein
MDRGVRVIFIYKSWKGQVILYDSKEVGYPKSGVSRGSYSTAEVDSVRMTVSDYNMITIFVQVLNSLTYFTDISVLQLFSMGMFYVLKTSMERISTQPHLILNKIGR